jgi:uncharacterized membrane protein (UPF0127 family)
VGIYYEGYGNQTPLNVKPQRISTSVAYLALDGDVVGIVDVMANDSRTQIPMASAKYAVQVRRGLFSNRAVKVGDRAFVREHDGTPYQFPNIPRGG